MSRGGLRKRDGQAYRWETEALREDVIRTSTERVSGKFQTGTRSPASFNKASFHSEASWTPGDGARAAEGPSSILGQG